MNWQTPSISASATWRSSNNTNLALIACSTWRSQRRCRPRARSRNRSTAGRNRRDRTRCSAQDVAAAANAVYEARGYETVYRTGRSIGVAYLEAPELKAGDMTVLQAGMTFAVDGGISIDGVTAGRIGDSVVVTETGFEYITNYPRELLVTDA